MNKDISTHNHGWSHGVTYWTLRITCANGIIVGDGCLSRCGCRFVSKATAGSGRAGGDRQFFFINGRPVDLPRFTKALNESFRSLSSHSAAASRPMAVINFQLPPDKWVFILSS